ncbi:DUF4126 domain-containing protein [Egbenema bharatensis]|uniref:DUF4126 domain-containing protein n=1 Tax=Egbenema bharatensis TaxID=3463334 RepID=UPI003A8C51B8
MKTNAEVRVETLNQLVGLEPFLEILLAISLSVATGFRIFIPLLVLSAAAVLGHFDYPAELDWLESSPALIVLSIACLLEIAGYYVPWFDNALDILATPSAIIAGTIVAASVMPDLDPIAQWTFALVAGGGAAGLTKGLMTTVRSIFTAASGGFANPIFSTLELVVATTLALLAVLVPALAILLVFGILVVAVLQLRQLFAKPSSPRSDQAPST